MSKIALSPNANGTGTFTLSAPNGNTSRTFELPDADGDLITSQSSLNASKLTGALPAISGAALTGLPAGTPAAGAVGSYVWGTSTASASAAPQFIFGTTHAGTGLFPAGFSTAQADTGSSGVIKYNANSSVAVLDITVSALSGTWRCMGQTPFASTFDEQPVVLFLRIL